ncbi:MAG TPA: septum formation initiator family protein [Candidatus Binatia bacterium]|nr:septum formation initiator family protein [Candidatus Binatia bacterium]
MSLRVILPQRWLIYLLGTGIVLLSLVTIVGERGALHLWRLRGEKSRLDEQNFRLQQENEALRRRIFRIRNDDDYLEKLAREDLNMVRPGEVVYRFQSPLSRGAARQELNPTTSESRPATARKEPR